MIMIETFQFDWTSVYNNERELREEFKIPANVDVNRNFWISNGFDYIYVLHETREGEVREFWRVHVWNNRDPREAIRAAINAEVISCTPGENVL